jgi:hypothetical protein
MPLADGWLLNLEPKTPTHPDANLMRRMQDSNFGQATRMGSLLIRWKRLEGQTDERGGRAA